MKQENSCTKVECNNGSPRLVDVSEKICVGENNKSVPLSMVYDHCDSEKGCIYKDTCDDGDPCTTDNCNSDGKCTHKGLCEDMPIDDTEPCLYWACDKDKGAVCYLKVNTSKECKKESNKDDETTLSTGAIAGIAVGCVVGAAVLLVAAILLVRHFAGGSKSGQSESGVGQNNEIEMDNAREKLQA